MSKPFKIVTIGDINEDILMVPLSYASDKQNDNKGRQKYLQITRDGGALLLEETIRDALYLIKKREEIQVEYQLVGYTKYLKENALTKDKALAILKLFPRNNDTKNSDQVYRLEKIFGWEFDSLQEREQEKEELLLNLTKQVLKSKNNDLPKFIIINDKGKQFRKIPLNDWFPCDHIQKKETTFILAMDKPLCEGALWEDLIEKYPQQTVVIVSASALRQAGVNIHETGSVEHLAQDLMAHTTKRDRSLVDKLLKCQHLIVNFDNNGVLHCTKSNNHNNDKVFINYCPQILQKEYLDTKRFGTMSGYTTILITSIVLSLSMSISVENLPPVSGQKFPYGLVGYSIFNRVLILYNVLKNKRVRRIAQYSPKTVASALLIESVLAKTKSLWHLCLSSASQIHKDAA